MDSKDCHAGTSVGGLIGTEGFPQYLFYTWLVGATNTHSLQKKQLRFFFYPIFDGFDEATCKVYSF